jgi:hypothetical protein
VGPLAACCAAPVDCGVEAVPAFESGPEEGADGVCLTWPDPTCEAAEVTFVRPSACPLALDPEPAEVMASVAPGAA